MVKGSSKRAGGTGLAKLDLPAGYKAQSFVRIRENGLVAKAAVDGGLDWKFSFQDIPDYTDFTNLYDAYIMDEVEIHFNLRTVGTNNQQQDFPTLYVAPDYDGDGTPLAVAAVTTKERCKMHQLSQFHNTAKIVVRPRAATSIYKGGVTSAYGWSPSNQLIDMNNVDVQMYGAVHWLAYYNSVITPNTYVSTTLVYKFRCVGQR